MNRLINLLIENRETILERWFHLILETYPSDTSALLRETKNQFQNPVGYTLAKETEAIFEELLQDMDAERLSTSLQNVIKIRSVQDFNACEAIGFIFLLKKAIQGMLGKEIKKEQILEEWLDFYSKIDEVALRAFDIYMDCREKICEIRINQARAEKEMAFRMIERMTKK